MEKEMENVLMESVLRDLTKPNIHPIMRGKICQRFMQERNLSYHRLAEIIGSKKTTVYDWVKFSKLTMSEYKDMEELGLTKTEITEYVKNAIPTKSYPQNNLSPFDFQIKSIISLTVNARRQMDNNKSQITEQSIILIKNLQNELNRILMRYEK